MPILPPPADMRLRGPGVIDEFGTGWVVEVTTAGARALLTVPGGAALIFTDRDAALDARDSKALRCRARLRRVRFWIEDYRKGE